MLKRLFLITSVFLFWTLLASAQEWDVKDDFQTKFTQLTTKDGLSDNRVLDIMQDKVGFIWLATENGLSRYDGYEFVVFQNIPTDTTSISSNIVTSIAEDKFGNLWVGTVFGLNKYNRILDRFTHYFFDPTNSNSIKDNHIRALLADDNGILWIETVDGHLHSLDIESGKINYYKHKIVSQEYYHYHGLFKENDSALWVGGRNSEVLRFNINSGEFRQYRSGQGEKWYKKTNDVSSYFKDSKGNFWVTGLDGAYILNTQTSHFQMFLPGSTFCIFEEENGTMWFGTGNGIFKHIPGSKQWTHITAQHNNPHSLSSMHVNKMMKDASGVLWIATNHGLSLYSPKKHNFSHYFHIPGQKQTISGNYISALAQDENSDLWIGTASYGLNRMNLGNGKIEKYEHQENKKSGLISNKISSLFFDSKKDLWIATWSGRGFNKLQVRNNQFTSFTIDPTTTNTDWFNGFLEDDQANILLAVWGGYGIYSLPNNARKILETGKNLTVIPNELCVTAMNDHPDSLLWLGGENGQINVYNLRTGSYFHLKNLFPDSKCSYEEIKQMQQYGFVKADIPHFDSIHQIVTFYKQSYFATELGLLKFDHNQKKIVQDFPDQLKTSFIQAMLVNDDRLTILSKGVIWELDYKAQIWNRIELDAVLPSAKPVQILKDSLNIYLATEDVFYQFNQQGKVLSTNKTNASITSIEMIDLSQIYLSAGNKLLMFKDGKLEVKSIMTEPIVDFIIEDNSIYWISNKMLYQSSLYLDELNPAQALIERMTPKIDFSGMRFSSISKKDNGIYVGSNKGMITYYLSMMRSFFTRHGEKYYMGFPVHLATCFYKDNDEIWVGTTSTGIARWNPKSQTLLNYWSNEFDSAALWGQNVSFVFKDSQEQIWVGSKGLNLYHPENDSFSHYTTVNGLPHNSVKGMVEDYKGRLWIATKNGLSCFSKPEQNFTNYFVSDGLPDNELTGAALNLDDDRLAFGSINGLVIFHPDSLRANHFIPPVVITEVLIQDNQIFRDLSQTDTIIIAADENRISFRFAALDYNSPEQNKYQYILKGIDENWSTTDADNRVINYSNLDPGTYEFKLKGSNNNDIWNEYGQSLTIIISPHFYQRWWFYLLAVLGVGFVVWMIVMYRVRELKLQQKAAELEQRFLRAQMNPHFIFNSLGAIQSFIFKNEPIEAATYLSNFSELVRLILDNSRQDLIPLQTEVKTLDHYLDLQKLRFGEKFDYQLEVDTDFEEHRIFIPPMLAQPFIENSIEHGFAGMKEKGMIRIRFILKANHIQLICEDNGMGIDASMKKKRENTKKHQSLATKITRERIHVLNQMYPSKIQLEIVDLKKVDKRKSGTRVVFNIPLNLKKKR